jgi:hypothetical protein
MAVMKVVMLAMLDSLMAVKKALMMVDKMVATLAEMTAVAMV